MRRRYPAHRTTALAVGAGLCALCGCSSASSGVVVPGPPRATGSALPRLATHVSAEPSLPWQIVPGTAASPGTPAAESTTRLEVGVAAGGCTAPAGWDAVWTSTTVTLTVYGTENPVGVQACDAIGLYATFTVTLGEPLGTRTLVHAPTSPDFPANFPLTQPTP
jgi:hypothetical protein